MIQLKQHKEPKIILDKSNKEKNIEFWKNSVLVAWILSLGIVSTLALGGNFSLVFEALSESIQSNLLKNSNSSLKIGIDETLAEKCQQYNIGTATNKIELKDLPYPSNILRCFSAERYQGKALEDIPPIGIVLDKLQTDTWRDRKYIRENNLNKSDYIALFEIIEKNLLAISLDNLQDVNNLKISNGILPYKFKFSKDKFVVRDVPLPIEAKNWVISERDRRAELRLVDTFFIVIILGALGSIIFLIREHMFSEDSIDVKLYFYRPTFGMLLAVGTFVFSISLNGLFSEGKIEDVKTNSFFCLAFIAGLLSESTYESLRNKAQERLSAEAESVEE